MPIYEYECQCGYRAEALMTFAQAIANPFICPECSEVMKKLVVGPFNFTLAQPGTAKSKVNPNARQVRR